jgi:hypothetical protein
MLRKLKLPSRNPRPDFLNQCARPVGFPRESRISRALTSAIPLINRYASMIAVLSQQEAQTIRCLLRFAALT